MERLRDKVALITGGGSGIGLAAATLFAREGAIVVISDIDAGKARAEAARLASEGLAVSHAAHDVTSEADWDLVVDGIVQQHGRLDIVVNNAGVVIFGDAETASLKDWRRIMSVNVDGVFLGTRKAIGAMKHRGGSIINVSSIEGIIGEMHLAAYNASKGGVRLFTKSAALHCADRGYPVRVNSIHPGYVNTPMISNIAAALPAEEAEAVHKDILSRIPMRRPADPMEIARAMLFMASDDSSYMTGAELVIDGGYTAR